MGENVATFPVPEIVERKPRPTWAKPYIWRPACEIPRRQWLYGQHYARQFVSLTAAPGGVGKSSLVLIEALAMASGKKLLHHGPTGRFRVWYFNGEDPAEETERRVAAACLQFGLQRQDLEGWLFLGSGRDEDLIVAEQTHDGVTINRPHTDAVEEMLDDLRIDVAMADPFVSTHRVSENDNGAIDAVAKTWARIADRRKVAVELVHHVRKGTGPGHEYTVEDGRGAVALLAASRSARVLNVMSEEEATRAGVENRRSHFRVDNGKANLAPPPEKSDWHKIIGEDLGNGTALIPGDSVGVVIAWAWPDHLAGVQAADLLKVQQTVAAGRWRENVQCKDWVGQAIADALGLTISDSREKARVKAMLKMWLASGALVTVTGKDESRREQAYVEVGQWVSLTPETFE